MIPPLYVVTSYSGSHNTQLYLRPTNIPTSHKFTPLLSCWLLRWITTLTYDFTNCFFPTLPYTYVSRSDTLNDLWNSRQLFWQYTLQLKRTNNGRRKIGNWRKHIIKFKILTLRNKFTYLVETALWGCQQSLTSFAFISFTAARFLCSIQLLFNYWSAFFIARSCHSSGNHSASSSSFGWANITASSTASFSNFAVSACKSYNRNQGSYNYFTL